MCLQKYSDEVVSASWDSVIFDLKEGPLKKIFMLEPLRGTEAHVRQLFAESPTAGDLLQEPRQAERRLLSMARRSLAAARSATTRTRASRSSCAGRAPPAARPREAGSRRGERARACPTAPRCSPCAIATASIMAGDRQASEGYQVASRRIEKIFKSDDLSGMGIAGAAGPAMEMARLFQTELEHYEKVEGENLSLDGKANKLGQMIRMNLPMAMQGLVVVPIFAGFDERAGVGRLFKYDVTGGRYEETDYFAQGSGGKDARDSLKKRFKRDMSQGRGGAGRHRGADRRGRRGPRHRRARPAARDPARR